MGDVARRLVHRLAIVAHDAGAAGGAEDGIDIAVVHRAAAERRAAHVERAGGHRRTGRQPGQLRHLVAQGAGLRIRRQQRREQMLQVGKPHFIQHHRRELPALLIEQRGAGIGDIQRRDAGQAKADPVFGKKQIARRRQPLRLIMPEPA